MISRILYFSILNDGRVLCGIQIKNLMLFIGCVYFNLYMTFYIFIYVQGRILCLERMLICVCTVLIINVNLFQNICAVC